MNLLLFFLINFFNAKTKKNTKKKKNELSNSRKQERYAEIKFVNLRLIIKSFLNLDKKKLKKNVVFDQKKKQMNKENRNRYEQHLFYIL